MRIRSLWALAIAAALLLPIAPASAEADIDPVLQDLRRCLQEERALSAVLMMDTSGSLNQTDPTDRRIIAAEAFVSSLTSVRDTAETGGTPITIDVMVAGFGSEFSSKTDGFVRLDARGESAIDAALDELRDDKSDPDTDYVRGLAGSTGELSVRDGCRLVIWFTDGRYDIGSKVERPDYEMRISPEDSPAADDRPGMYTSVGREWLCEATSGIADEMRSYDIRLIAVALSFEPPEELDFTRRITEGRDSRNQTCGSRLDDAARLGRFSNVTSDELIFEFANLLVPPDSIQIATGEVHVFGLPYGTTSARLVATSGTLDDSYSIELTGPSSQVRQIEVGEGRFRFSGVDVRPQWLSDTIFILDLRPDPDKANDWKGDWQLKFFNAPDAHSETALLGILKIEPLKDNISAPLGSVASVTFSVRDAAGTPATVGEPYPMAASALISDGGAVLNRYDAPLAGEQFTVEVDTTSLVEGQSLEIAPAVTIFVNGVEIRYEGETATLTVDPPPPTTTLPPPPTAPEIDTTELHLGSFETPGSSSEASFVVSAGNVAGCVSFRPVDADTVSLGIESDALLSSECGGYTLAASTSETFHVVMTTSERIDGPIRSGIEVRTSTSDGGTVSTTQILVDATGTKPRSTAKLIPLFLLLSAVGVGAPLLFLGVKAKRAVRFAPDRNDLLVGAVPLTFSMYKDDDKNTFATDIHVSDPPVGSADFEIVGSRADSKGQFELAPADFPTLQLPAPLKVRVASGFIGGQHGVATAAGHHILTPYGSGTLSTDLSGAWIFVVATASVEGSVVNYRGVLCIFEDATSSTRPDWTRLDEEVDVAAQPHAATIFEDYTRQLAQGTQDESSTRRMDPSEGDSLPTYPSDEAFGDTADQSDDGGSTLFEPPI